MNCFDFFEIPVAFKIDEAALRRKYLLNSKNFHPDFHSLSGKEKQAEMLELSSRNNQAWKTLSDFDSRLKHVLELKSMLAAEGENKLPQGFLMEVMDINENLMELEFDFDQNRFEETLNSVQDLDNQLLASVQPVLENWSENSGDDAGLEKVRDYFFKKKYLSRILENLYRLDSSTKMS